MSNYAERLDRLETQRRGGHGLVIGLPVFAPNGELSGYQIGDEVICRDIGEERGAFVARVRALCKHDVIVLFVKDDEKQ